MSVRTKDLPQVSSGLNLWLELNDSTEMNNLLRELEEEQAAIRAALTNLHYVHFARFLPSEGDIALQVITEFDGEFDAYVLDFVLAIGDQFEIILKYVKNRPPKTVKDHPAEFLAFVNKHNSRYGGSEGFNIGLYSAYPQRTVIDIIGASGMAPAVLEPPPVPVDGNDVQANVLRGISATHALHVGLEIGDPPGARALLNELLSGTQGAPLLSNDATWWPAGSPRPAYALTLGFTYAGLEKLGISAPDRAAFTLAHPAFIRGPDEPETAIKLADIGQSAPARWKLGGAYPVDMVVSLYTADQTELDKQYAALKSRCDAHAVSLVNRTWAAQALIDVKDPQRRYLHFGYADGMAQPRLAIQGASAGDPDMQPKAGVGELLLGAHYPNVFGGSNSLGGLSAALAENATFAALRILEQDVTAFEALLDEASAAHGVDREWLAAKLMGRWRDGTPLVQSPDRPLPESVAPPRNQFDFLPSMDNPLTFDDSAGLRCPVGAHARRMNPRSAVVAGHPHSRRLVRRGMPYGPKYDAGRAGDREQRGLVGLFLCADLDRQFEFIMRQWAQGDHATVGLVGQQDPIIGAQASLPGGNLMQRDFRIAMPGGETDIVLKMPRLVKTIGSAYLFMPGLAGVRHLTTLGAVSTQETKALPSFATQLRALHTWNANAHLFGLATAPPAPDPATLDPRAKDFRDDPFFPYAWFRANMPIAYLPAMESTWVFNHELVSLIAGDQKHFHKRKSNDDASAGLLNMDPKPHLDCRNAIQPLFDTVLQTVEPTIKATVAQCYRANCQNMGSLDLMLQFAQPVAHAVFFDVFGLSVDEVSEVITDAETILAMMTPKDIPTVRANIKRSTSALGAALHFKLRKARKPGRMFDQILAGTQLFDNVSNQPYLIFTALQVEQLANAATLTMAGFLPLQWFIALASWRLLEKNGALLTQIRNDKNIKNRAVVDELLRYDMSPPMSDRYVAGEDTVVGGITFKRDDRLTLSWASASRDNFFGANPDTIDFARAKGPGWAFGDAGQHSCMGSEMVYLVMEPVIETLRNANPMPRLDPTFVPEWGTPKDGAMFRRMTSLDVIC